MSIERLHRSVGTTGGKYKLLDDGSSPLAQTLFIGQLVLEAMDRHPADEVLRFRGIELLSAMELEPVAQSEHASHELPERSTVRRSSNDTDDDTGHDPPLRIGLLSLPRVSTTCLFLLLAAAVGSAMSCAWPTSEKLAHKDHCSKKRTNKARRLSKTSVLAESIGIHTSVESTPSTKDVIEDDHPSSCDDTMRRLEDHELCVVCLDAPRTHVALPCGHKCVCASCARFGAREEGHHEHCPLCRVKLDGFLRVWE